MEIKGNEVLGGETEQISRLIESMWDCVVSGRKVMTARAAEENGYFGSEEIEEKKQWHKT